MESDFQKETAGFALFFISIALLLIDILSESIIGPVGVWIKNLGFGFIGISAYLIPVYLCYMGIEFFWEKSNVSRRRIVYVFLLMVCFAALLSVTSTDFEYVKSLCLDPASNKFKATKAISLLWHSGPDSSLITNPNSTTGALPGGIIGGSIAIALNSVVGKIISVLILIVVILSQVILVFKISLKKHAIKAVSSASKAVKNATVRINSGNAYGKKYNGQIRRDVPYNPNHAPMPRTTAANAPVRSNPVATAPSPVSNYPYVNLSNGNSPVVSNQPLPPRNPKGKSAMPVDGNTGFIDTDALSDGKNVSNDPNVFVIGSNKVSFDENKNFGSLEGISIDSKPMNPHLRDKKEFERPSFLPEDKPKKDFYNLEGAVYANGEEHYENEFTPDDLPTELDDVPYNSVDETYDQYPADVDPYTNPYNKNYAANPAPAPAPVPAPIENQVQEVAPAPVSDLVQTNETSESLEPQSSYDPLKGREVHTTEANPAASTDFNAPEVQKPQAQKIKRITRYTPPPMNLLAPEAAQTNNKNDASVKEKGIQLVETLKSFGIDTEVVHTTFGPAITRYELKFKNAGVKVSRVLSLENDIALAMAAISVRIEAPIPGTSYIGIEIPNEKTSAVQLSGLIRTPEFKKAKPLEVPLGKNISGNPIMCDLAKMPHLLIAGSTGSGKSVCINTILASILYHSSPNDARMILIDPKVVELSIYNGIPHLLMPVVTDPKKAISALKWAALEMDRRYKLFAETNVRNLDGYNDYLRYNNQPTLPLILIVVDELADLMTLAKNEVEEQISRLAAMARAAGLHLILATQRPSVDVISGVIKANVPSRIAFAVSSGTDSRTILDSNGAEKLLGKGDMLYAPNSAPKAVRGQGAFLSDKEVDSIVQDLRKRYGDMYDDAVINIVNSQAANSGATGGTGMGVSEASGGAGADDELLDMAVDVVIEAKNASVSILQRRLGIGYPRAARLIDVLEQKHVIGPFEGSKPRKVLMTKTDWLEQKSKG